VGRERTVERLEQEWRALLAAVDAVPGEALTRPGVTGDWSVRDLLAHISSWEVEFLQAVPIILADRRLPRYSATYGGIDAFNALVRERARAQSLDELRRALTDTHARLLATLAETPLQEARIEARLRRRLSLDTYRHYREHIDQIEVWARGLGS
jgi:uncharacterized protein (TIGR03083 family)